MSGKRLRGADLAEFRKGEIVDAHFFRLPAPTPGDFVAGGGSIIPRMSQDSTHKRTLAKTVTWRVVATATTMLIVYAFTGQATLSVGVGLVEVVAKMLIYYPHELAWDRVSWGWKRHPLSDLPVNGELKPEDREQIVQKLRELGYLFRALYLGIRRDEHGMRAKERVFSPRDEDFEWNYKEQPAEAKQQDGRGTLEEPDYRRRWLHRLKPHPPARNVVGATPGKEKQLLSGRFEAK